jgi:hypothetical protein
VRRSIVPRINRDPISHVFDLHQESVLRGGGEVFQVETEDSRNGLTRMRSFASSIVQSHSATAEKTVPGLAC